MIDIRIPVRPAKAAPPKTNRTPIFKQAAEGYLVINRPIVLANNAGGGFKVPARMPKF